MAEKSKKPAIRFAGFTEAWEQRKLGELGTTFTGLSGKSKGDFGHGDARFITYINVFSNPIADLRMTESVEIDFKQNCVKQGDVFFTTSSETPEEVGMSCVMPENIDNMYLNSFCFGYRPIEKFDLSYLAYALRSTTFRKGMIFLAQGISRYNISKNKAMDLEISVPSLEEQGCIGRYFNHLDNLITLHQRKYDKLVNVKKAMLEKMFPKDGSDVPEIRFKGFTEAWEQRKFEDITYLSGERNRDNNIFESYSVTNDKGFVPQVEQFENGGTMTTADKSMYYIVSKNSFAYNPARINVGSIGYYDKPEKVIVSSLYEVFKTINNINDRFLWHWFKSDAFQKMIEQYQEGGVRLYFYYDKLCVCLIDIPKYEEQYMIGEMLDKLDNLITLHQRKLEKLKNLKKACLEKMFV